MTETHLDPIDAEVSCASCQDILRILRGHLQRTADSDQAAPQDEQEEPS